MTLFDNVRQNAHNRAIQHTVLDIKDRYGRNAILKGMNLTGAATTPERNRQIGGHKA